MNIIKKCFLIEIEMRDIFVKLSLNNEIKELEKCYNE